MKTRCFCTVITFLLLVGPLYGQGPSQSAQSDSTVANLFAWSNSTPPDWATGSSFALLGLVGALFTVFSLIGGAIPGTAGYVRIEAGLKRVEEREKKLDDLIKGTGTNPEVIKAVEAAANNLRDDLRSERQRQFLEAAVLYTILGAFVASALARDFLQAVVIGAGWTAYLGAFGLKKDYAARKEVKDEVIEKLEKVQGDSGPPPGFDELREEARIARAL